MYTDFVQYCYVHLEPLNENRRPEEEVRTKSLHILKKKKKLWRNDKTKEEFNLVGVVNCGSD